MNEIDLETMETYYLTFGSQYAVEAHPNWKKAHPNGYVVVVAPNELAARALAFGTFGTAWSMIYHSSEFNPLDEEHQRWYPKGKLGVIISTIDLIGAPR